MTKAKRLSTEPIKITKETMKKEEEKTEERITQTENKNK
jgi:hypothetical protein